MSAFIEKVSQLERSAASGSLTDQTIDDIKNQIIAKTNLGFKEMKLKFEPVGGTRHKPDRYSMAPDFSTEIRRWLIAEKFEVFSSIEEVTYVCGTCRAYDGHGDMGCGQVCKRTERKQVWKMMLE